MDDNITILRPGISPAQVRSPPYNGGAEQTLLGTMLFDNSLVFRVGEYLLPEHFGNAIHARIFDAITKLVARGQVANPVTLKNVFDQDGSLAEIGGAQYLAKLASEGALTVNPDDYGRIILDLHLRRELISLGEDVVDAAYTHDIDDPAPRQIERIEQSLFDLATRGTKTGGLRPFSGALTRAIQNAEAAFKRGGKTVGVATGFLDLDRLLGGFHASDLIVLAGRPSMGKTALATNIAFSAALSYRAPEQKGDRAEDGAVVAIFSLEMSVEQLATRILSEQSGVATERIRRGQISNQDFDQFISVSRRLASLPMYIDDTPGLTVPALRARARRLMRTHGLGLIVVDYLQLMTIAGRRPENRVQEIAEITRGLKETAKDLAVPILALSQLSRQVEQREDKRPLLSDLRESGSIEQDADAVIFIFREEYYLREPDPSDLGKWSAWRDRMAIVKNKAELIVAKHRNGPTGSVNLRFDPARTKFDNFAGGVTTC